MTKFFRSTLLLTVLVGSPAMAGPAPANSQVIVRTADLDLSNPAGQRRLDRRLANAVVQACGEASDVDLAGSNAVRRCRDETRAHIAVDRERLVELASRSAPIVVAAR